MSRKEAASEEAKTVRQDIALAVHQAYYGQIAARVTHAIAGKNLTRAKDHLRLAKERFDAGAAPQLDVFRAQVEASDARLSLVKADNLVRVSRGTLNTAMGLPVELPVEIEVQEENAEEPNDSHSRVTAKPESPSLRTSNAFSSVLSVLSVVKTNRRLDHGDLSAAQPQPKGDGGIPIPAGSVGNSLPR